MRGGPTKEMKERAARRHARDQKWRKGNRIRSTWSEAEKQAEEERLAAEIAGFLAARDARKAL